AGGGERGPRRERRRTGRPRRGGRAAAAQPGRHAGLLGHGGGDRAGPVGGRVAAHRGPGARQRGRHAHLHRAREGGHSPPRRECRAGRDRGGAQGPSRCPRGRGAMTDRDWLRTGIGASDADSITVMGRDLASELMGEVTFTELTFLLVQRRMPEPEETRLLDAVLVSLADHGLTPTVLAARLTHTGAPESIQGAIAAG